MKNEIRVLYKKLNLRLTKLSRLENKKLEKIKKLKKEVRDIDFVSNKICDAISEILLLETDIDIFNEKKNKFESLLIEI